MSTHNIEISWFKKFAEANGFIKRFSFGEPSTIDLGKEGQYPIMHVQYNGSTYGDKSISSAYAITLLDLPIDAANKVENQREVISDMRQVAEDILAAIRNGDAAIFPREVNVENPNITVFVEDNSNVLSGVQLDLNLTYPFLYNFCISPLGTGTETPNLPSTEYSTGRIRISQNETELGYARELNFDDSFEVTLVGNVVYITALGGGGGGGGSTWYDGAGVPSSGTGSNGDYYLRTSNGDVYRKSSGAWSVVGNIKGPAGNDGADGADGPAIELQVNATHIQWRVVGASTWIDLVALSTITGSDGREIELRVATNIIQWRYVGDVAWNNLYDLTTLPVGGDATGTVANINVSKVHGIDFQNGTPSDGQLWRYDTTSSKWKHYTLTASGISDATTVGQKLVQLTNPSAVTFLRVNADNSVDALNATNFRTAIGLGTAATQNVGTFAQVANNLSDLASASTARTNLGATTVGSNIFTKTNPSAVTYLRINADNTVDFLSASDFRTAIGVPSQDTLTWGNTPVASIGASTTTYNCVSSGGTVPFSASESLRAIRINFNYEVLSLSVRLSGAQPASGSLVATLRKGTSVAGLADTTIVATVAANGQDAESTASPITGSDGDYISVKFTNNATGTSGVVLAYYLELRRTS